MILVSSCLAGMKVRYNGTDCLENRLKALLDSGRAVAVCPELLGGFVTPREPAEITGGTGRDVLDGRARVIDRSGKDVTAMYLEGAQITLDTALKFSVSTVVLKQNSPSCGSAFIYNGEFTGIKMSGEGVTAALLRKNGIEVISEQELADRLGELE
ncbi:hypothetical protein R70723_25285 [Paenibacillus sp. FSL R7-0273]|uniref:DUF523 domain-containing protein n=1 Tax=Paenibacillus sp. FSL R7-0273 TaxID=1536772 RepID=UPI0004F5F475|nr:DUF523 domain-containing protein [Paenibacillus sp. FSL R7-0273]AIQ48851.1 hypothetical protein R70723_25285 [Paenibacillus sp. FSL R7-0273]OMF91270.1 hypothetical protein BK144_16225 [Paenibacillus sp. FSL R7-0273]